MLRTPSRLRRVPTNAGVVSASRRRRDTVRSIVRSYGGEALGKAGTRKCLGYVLDEYADPRRQLATTRVVELVRPGIHEPARQKPNERSALDVHQHVRNRHDRDAQAKPCRAAKGSRIVDYDGLCEMRRHLLLGLISHRKLPQPAGARRTHYDSVQSNQIGWTERQASLSQVAGRGYCDQVSWCQGSLGIAATGRQQLKGERGPGVG